MRAFIALEIPQEAKDRLSLLQQELRQAGADVKWVNPAQLHLTLKFLGEIDEAKARAVMGGLAGRIGATPAFAVRFSGAGAFPSAQNPRIIWAGIGLNSGKVCALAACAEEAGEKEGIPREDKPFTSHITLGRARSSQGKVMLARKLSGVSVQEGLFPEEYMLRKVTLFKSTLSSLGPSYEPITEISLTTA